MGFSGWNWVTRGYNGLYWVTIGQNGLSRILCRLEWVSVGETGLHEVIMGYNRSRWSCNGLKNDICGLEWLEVGYTGCLMKPGPIRLRRPNFLQLLRSFFLSFFFCFVFFWVVGGVHSFDKPTVAASHRVFVRWFFFWSIFHLKKIKKEKKNSLWIFHQFRSMRSLDSIKLGWFLDAIVVTQVLAKYLVDLIDFGLILF